MDLRLTTERALVTGASQGIGRAVASLASPCSAYINGAVLTVDGGRP